MGRKSRKRRAGRTQGDQCVYCGVVGELTSDHIPPKNLFSKPRPSNLITVPCCEPCNKGIELDDEYFRLVVILRQDIGDHPEFKRLWPTVYKSLERRKNHGFTNSLLQGMANVDVTSPGGLYLGRLPTYHVDLIRLDRVAARIAKGLFYHEFGQRLPDDYDVVSYNESGVAGNPASTQALQVMCAKLITFPRKTIGADAFSYWFARAYDNPNASAWLMTFFKRVPFVCLTLPKELAVSRSYTHLQNPYVG